MEALVTLREQLHAPLRRVLLARGAREHDADDLLADLWRDCLADGDDVSLLERRGESAPVKAWLATVLTRRLIDRQRRERRQTALDPRHDSAPSRWVDGSPGDSPADNALNDLLAGALREAFQNCRPEALVMLRLVHLHGLTQREVGRMWGWHETKVSRLMSGALEDIRERALSRLRESDPWLRLTWRDLVEVCAYSQESWLPH